MSAAPDPTRIVSGALPVTVRAMRAPRPAMDATRGRNIQAQLQTRYRLQRADGAYLRLDAGGYVTEITHSWIGFAHQLRTLCERQPELVELTVIRVQPPSRGAFNPTATR